MSALRLATRADIPALIELAGSSFREAYEDIDDPQEISDHIAANFTADYFSTAIESSAVHLVVLADSHELLGYLLLKKGAVPACVDDQGALELEKIYLRRSQIGRGFGKQLMQHAFTYARDAGHHTLWLQVYSENKNALRFYARSGFVERGVVDFWFGGRAYQDPVLTASVANYFSAS